MNGWQGPPVLVGEKALWLGSGSGLPKVAIVRWIGHLPEIGPDWTVGLELVEALPVGGIDGTWRGRVLFTCKAKHGLIVPVSSIIPGSQFKHIPTNSSLELCDNAGGQASSQSLFSNAPPITRSVLTEGKSLPRPGVGHKRRIPTPPSSDSEEPAGEEVPEETGTQLATLRVEERDQEDSLKKRLRLFTDSHGAIPRVDRHYEFSSDEAVIDSLYAQRRHQFIKNGRSQSESNQAFISASSSAASRRERSSAIFSIFRWFRKENRSNEFDEFAPSAPPSPQLIRGLSSSCNSVDTLFSTATASSFAFVHPALYRPFGAANAPEKRIIPGPETDTYRNRLRQRDRTRELDKNISLNKKYRLFGSGTLHRSADDVSGRHIFPIKSIDSLKPFDVSLEGKNSTLGRKKRKAPHPPSEQQAGQVTEPNIVSENDKENTDFNSNTEINPVKVNANRLRHRRTVSDSAKDRKSFVHVKGKRKAPPPPSEKKQVPYGTSEIIGTQSLGRKKRAAPPPPLDIKIAQRNENSSEDRGSLSPEEKQRLIENITKLQVHADRRSLLITTPPSSPILNNKMSHTVYNDSLKLEKGVLKANKSEVQSLETKPVSPTPVSPRPWYKRNSSNKDKSLDKKKSKPTSDNWMPEVAISRSTVSYQDSNSNNITSSTSSSSNTSYRLSSIFSRFEKPEEKRKSQISMLVNISELDREAAEIVQRGQEKEKAVLAAQDAKYYTSAPVIPSNPASKAAVECNNIENIDTPKRTGARELISLFNAIGNVKKVTANSSFFSKDNSIVLNKDSVDKNIGDNSNLNTSAEKVVKYVNTSSVYTNEILIESKETYLESPGVKRRRNLAINAAGPSSSTYSEVASPDVVIQEIESNDTEMSKIQALYEANKIRKHLTPSPTIPTIAEMSESMSSVTTSPGSTIIANDRSVSTTPTPVAARYAEPLLAEADPSAVKPANDRSVSTTPTPVAARHAEPHLAVADPSDVKPANNYSIWSCPRCTLENPRWRVTCEACEMWRPAVRRDVIDKLTNANMGTTIAVNVIKGDEPKKVPTKTSISTTNTNSQAAKPNDKAPTQIGFSKSLIQNKSSISNLSARVNLNRPTTDLKGPITVSGLLAGNSYQPDKLISDLNIKEDRTIPPTNSSCDSIISRWVIPTSSNQSVLTQLHNEVKSENKVPNTNSSNISRPSSSTHKFESEIEEVRKARLAFFKNSQSEDDKEMSREEISKKIKQPIDKAKIEALFSMTSKGSLATNDEERKKVKELLKEMKDSLPKKNKQGSSQSEPSQTTSKTVKDEPISHLEANENTTCDAAKRGAIRKTILQNPANKSSGSRKDENIRVNETAEIFTVNSKIIVEEIKVKSKNDSRLPKVSTSVQTNGIVRKIEPTLAANVESKTVTEKPPTPKIVRKEVIVPVTVEEHVIKDGDVHKTTSKEPRKMDIRAFDLIRPRDFMNIEVTKTGKEVKPSTHVYANIPSKNNDDTSSNSSSSSDSPEISQLTAQLTDRNGLADFKASVLEGAAGNKMNTLAVNRLLRQLESAIAGGQHTRAATLAKELAHHKVNCSVTRHRKEEMIQLDMYVEDRQSHQGPFPVHVSPGMTVAELKAIVERHYELPVAVQRWILGKALAAEDTTTLKQLGVDKPRTPVFLYLVAPDGSQDKAQAGEIPTDNLPSNTSLEGAVAGEGSEAAAAPTAPPGRGWYFNDQDDRYSLCESEVTEPSRDPSPDAIPEPESLASGVVIEEVETEEDEEVEEDVEEEALGAVAGDTAEASATVTVGTLTIGWKCEVCTLVNSPTRPGCLACATDRPAGYIVPANHEARGSERLRIEENQRTDQAAIEDKRRNYEQLMMLENADLIPASGPFECAVCLTDCAAVDGVVLRDCLHTFCRACLAHTVKFSEEAEVRCPFRDHSYACQSTLQEREIKAECAAEEEEDDSCIVCMAEPRACALTPCGHRAYCETCCLRLIQLDQMCSLCRRKADGYLLIYL